MPENNTLPENEMSVDSIGTQPYYLDPSSKKVNINVINIECISARQRRDVIDYLAGLGYKWHGNSGWYGRKVEVYYPWEAYKILEIMLSNLHMSGSTELNLSLDARRVTKSYSSNEAIYKVMDAINRAHNTNRKNAVMDAINRAYNTNRKNAVMDAINRAYNTNRKNAVTYIQKWSSLSGGPRQPLH